MSEEQKQDGMDLATANENVTAAKTALSEAKAALRKFKKTHKARTIEKLKDDEDGKKAAEFTALEEAITNAQEEVEAAKQVVADLKPAKGKGGKGTSYTYGKIIDKETGEERDLTDTEKKKWRTHARKEAKKEEMEASQVPFDPSYFEPKVSKKAEKKAAKEAAKAEKEAAKAEKEPEADATAEAEPKKKKKRARAQAQA